MMTSFSLWLGAKFRTAAKLGLAFADGCCCDEFKHFGANAKPLVSTSYLKILRAENLFKLGILILRGFFSLRNFGEIYERYVF